MPDDSVQCEAKTCPRSFPPIICAIAPAIIALPAMLACWQFAGPTLGFYFGGFFIAAILAPSALILLSPPLIFRGRVGAGVENLNDPPISTTQPPPQPFPGMSGEGIRNKGGTCPFFYRGIISATALTLAIALPWLAAVNHNESTLGQWLQLTLALFLFILASASLSLLLAKYLDQTIAVTFIVLIGMAWLTWPVWLCSYLAKNASPQTVNVLVEVHPLLVANGVLKNESPLTERTVAYHLTNFNQDIPIDLPDSAWKCACFHGAIALICLGLSLIFRGNNPAAASRSTRPPASP